MALNREVLISVLNVNATSFLGGTQVHLKSFRESLGIAMALMARLSRSGAPLRIFVAPEYFFSQKVEMPRRVGGGTKTGYMPVSAQQGAQLLTDLFALSAQYPGVLIFAGSIHYMEGIGKKTTYNLCPILHGGRPVHLYHKKSDDTFAGDVLNAPDFAGGSESPLFNFGDLRFGVEICLDHGRRVLEDHLTSSGDAAPQIQVLVSRGMMLSRIRATDLAIHCDMSPGIANAGTVKRGDGTEVPSILTSRPVSDGSFVECFRVAREWVGGDAGGVGGVGGPGGALGGGGAPIRPPMMGTRRGQH